MPDKLFRGDITNSVVELNLLDEESGSDVGTLSYGIGGTNNGEIKVVHKGDVTQGDGFYNQTDIKGLVIGTSCTSIGSYAFYSCYNLAGDLVIPNSVTTIGSGAFYIPFGNIDTRSAPLIIPDSVTSIGSNAFYYCSGITAVYTNTPASSFVGSNAFSLTTFTTIYTGPNATGYTPTFQGRTGLTIANWDNYPHPIPN